MYLEYYKQTQLYNQRDRLLTVIFYKENLTVTVGIIKTSFTQTVLL